VLHTPALVVDEAAGTQGFVELHAIDPAAHDV